MSALPTTSIFVSHPQVTGTYELPHIIALAQRLRGTVELVEGPDARPIKLQGHHNEVRFRNVWIQRLSLGEMPDVPSRKGGREAR